MNGFLKMLISRILPTRARFMSNDDIEWLHLHLAGEAFQVLDWLTSGQTENPQGPKGSYVFFFKGKIWENNDQLSTSGFIYYSCIAKKNPKLGGFQVTKLVVGQMGMGKRGIPIFRNTQMVIEATQNR